VTIHGTPRTTTYGYDPVGRPTLVQRPAVQDNLEGTPPEERRQYDKLGKLASIEHTGLGVPRSLSLSHDLLGRPTSVVSAQGTRFGFSADGLSQRQEELGPDTGQTSRRLDASGNLIAVTDALGTVTVHMYDALNRRIGTTRRTSGNAEMDEVRYTWDNNPGAVCVRPSHLDGRRGAPEEPQEVADQRCGSNSSMRLAGCVGSRSSTSFRYA
jgi:YD repeat-containing protein